MKYHDTGKWWTFVTVSACENSVNAIMGGVGLLLNSRVQKSQNSMERIQPRMMCTSFNGNLCPITVSCNNPNNARDETDIITFYDEIFPLVWHIPKHKGVIIGGDINAHIGKDGNDKLRIHDTLHRIGKYLENFSFTISLLCENTKLQPLTPQKKLRTKTKKSGREIYETIYTQITLKHC